MDGDEVGVTLMTLHNAKGLEFPVVFILGMEEDLPAYPEPGRSQISSRRSAAFVTSASRVPKNASISSMRGPGACGGA